MNNGNCVKNFQLYKNHKLDIKSVRYQLVDIKVENLFTRIQVKLPPPPPPRQKGWFESLSDSIQVTQNKMVNSLVDKINEVTGELTRDEEELSVLKIYH